MTDSTEQHQASDLLSSKLLDGRCAMREAEGSDRLFFHPLSQQRRWRLVLLPLGYAVPQGQSRV
jgi:hypothetical protein